MRRLLIVSLAGLLATVGGASAADAKGSGWSCRSGSVSAAVGSANATRTGSTLRLTSVAANSANGWRVSETRRGAARSVEAKWRKGRNEVKWEAQIEGSRVKQKTCTRTK